MKMGMCIVMQLVNISRAGSYCTSKSVWPHVHTEILELIIFTYGKLPRMEPDAFSMNRLLH